MSARRFADFLAGSFEVLQREMPSAYADMCRRISPRAVLLEVDEERVAVRFDGAGARMSASEHAPAIRVQVGRRAILDLIDAESTLLDSILSERMVLLGSPADLIVFHDALMVYLQAAVRAPSFPDLLRAFRGSGDSTTTSSEPRPPFDDRESSWPVLRRRSHG